VTLTTVAVSVHQEIVLRKHIRSQQGINSGCNAPDADTPPMTQVTYNTTSPPMTPVAENDKLAANKN